MTEIYIPKMSDYFNTRLLPDGVTHWALAHKHIGEQITAYGEVVGTYFNYDKLERYIGFPEIDILPPPTYIEIGATYPKINRVKLIIWGKDRNKWDVSPDRYFENSTVVFSGEPYLYNDIVCIRIDDPKQIQIVEPIKDLYTQTVFEDFQDPWFLPVCQYMTPKESNSRNEGDIEDDCFSNDYDSDIDDPLGYHYTLDLGDHKETFIGDCDSILTEDGEWVDPDEYRLNHYRRPW